MVGNKLYDIFGEEIVPGICILYPAEAQLKMRVVYSIKGQEIYFLYQGIHCHYSWNDQKYVEKPKISKGKIKFKPNKFVIIDPFNHLDHPYVAKQMGIIDAAKDAGMISEDYILGDPKTFKVIREREDD